MVYPFYFIFYVDFYIYQSYWEKQPLKKRKKNNVDIIITYLPSFSNDLLLYRILYFR